ncbi:MAG: hypothetical protein QF470_07470 [Methylococcales bacterium]|jgi:hypothetical protein|nr:hypothetical protein [Methylococcales bacterium]
MKKLIMGIVLVVTVMYGNTVWAEEGTRVPCVKPRFSKMLPADKSEIDPGSEFSFVASKQLDPYTLQIKLKDVEVNEYQVKNKNSFYVVSGTFPDSVKGKWARVHIRGVSTTKAGGRGCYKNGGWLLKIKGDDTEVTP